MFTVLSDSIHLATGVQPANSVKANARHYVTLDKPNHNQKSKKSTARKIISLFGGRR